jgi:hypothetical protein
LPRVSERDRFGVHEHGTGKFLAAYEALLAQSENKSFASIKVLYRIDSHGVYL